MKDKPDLGVDPHKDRRHSARDLTNMPKAHSGQKGIYPHPAKRRIVGILYADLDLYSPQKHIAHQAFDESPIFPDLPPALPSSGRLVNRFVRIDSPGVKPVMLAVATDQPEQ
ncbi:MAG: hypothetical protein AAF724_21695 [Pseudomonadota bacterium]